jgi:hypothetical protein
MSLALTAACSSSPDPGAPQEEEITVGTESSAINEYCSGYSSANGNTARFCNLYAGTWTYDIYNNNLGYPYSPQALYLTNASGADLVIITTTASASNNGYWWDFCAQRSGGTIGPQGQPGMSSMGVGEVNCTRKAAGQGYSPLYTTGYEGSGHVLHPGEGWQVQAGGTDHPTYHTITVQAAAGAWTNEAIAIRQPMWDTCVACTGGQNNTPVQPLRNTTGVTLYIDGVSIYNNTAGSINGSGCVQVLNTAGAARWSYCNNGLQGPGYRGSPWAGMVAVYPNEYVFGIGYNTCSGGCWDYAQYITGKYSM